MQPTQQMVGFIVQETVAPVLAELDEKVPFPLLSSISIGLGEVIHELLARILDNVRLLGLLSLQRQLTQNFYFKK